MSSLALKLWFSHNPTHDTFLLSNILVFKLGGTSLSISVMEVNSGIYRVLSTNTDDNIGGIHFTETLAQYLASEFHRWVLMDLIIFFDWGFSSGLFFLIYFKLPCFKGGCVSFSALDVFVSRVIMSYAGSFREAEAKLPGALCSDFLLSVVGSHQMLSCMNWDIKFDVLILHVLLLDLDKVEFRHWGLTVYWRVRSDEDYV